MKKIVSMGEFKSYCEETRCNTVLFFTENQTGYDRFINHCRAEMTFQVILAYENPNVVCLKSGNNNVLFECVKFVEIDSSATVLGTVVTLYCGDFNSDGYNETYTLIIT